MNFKAEMSRYDSFSILIYRVKSLSFQLLQN